jgi:AcrR family transcriptional regulator
MRRRFPNRKDSIILAAIDIINDSGLQSLSTKELARRQEINESLLYKYFKSKDDIIVAVLEYYSAFDESINQTVSERELPFKEKILEYYRLYMEYYENYPAITAVLFSYHSFLKDPVTQELVKDIFDKRSRFLAGLVAHGIEKGEVSGSFTAQEITAILFGFSREMISRWWTDGFTYSLKEYTQATLKKLLELL